MENKIPTYKIIVNPDDELTGVYAVSLVNEPAIEVDWIALSKIDLENFLFTANTDKQVLYGPLLIPDKLILRRDDKGNEYNIVFDKDTIELIAEKYNERKLGDIFNIQHSEEKVEAYLSQNWITGKMDKSKELGFELPDGTWFGAVKVKNGEFWNSEVKSGKLKGFSVEIKAGTKLIDLTTSVDKNKYLLMEYKTKAGLTLTWEGEAAVGKDIFIVMENGDKEPLANGEYELENGVKVVAEDGKVKEIIAPKEDMTEDSDLQEDPTKIADDMNRFNDSVKEVVIPMFDELRGVIAELQGRIDKMEMEHKEMTDGEDYGSKKKEEYMAKISDLENKVENLSKVAGAPSIKELNDLEKAKIDKYEDMVRRINFYKNK